MQYNPNVHHRRSVRLKGHDYSNKGLYFITICTKGRECLFGYIAEGRMTLNETGKIAEEYLRSVPEHFNHVMVDEYAVMPNHVHMILALNEQSSVGTSSVGTSSVGTSHVGTSHVMSLPREPHQNKFSKPVAGSVSVIIQQYKSSVKRWCDQNNRNNFEWQSRFHDHIIRNAESYERIKQYIRENPARWNADTLYAANR
jgi:putative transposase